jgi:hypothetical protein
MFSNKNFSIFNLMIDYFYAILTKHINLIIFYE